MKTAGFSAALVLALTCSLHAQQTADTVSVEPVVVTASRVALPVSKATASVAVVDVAELQQRGIRNVGDALREVAGAAVVQNGSYGGVGSLFLRGGESDYVLVLLDGVQINSPGEQFNFGTLALENIERIEIVKGPTSVLYGSDAVTGVVQLFTRQHAGKMQGSLQLRGGVGEKTGPSADGNFSQGYFAGDLAGSAANLRYSLGVSHFETGGLYAFNNEHRNTSVTGRGVWEVSPRTDLTASARFSTSRYHIPTDGSGQLVDRNQYADNSSVTAALGALHRFSDRLHAQLDVHYNHNDAVTDDRADDPADTVGFYRFRSDERFARRSVGLRADYRLASSTLTLGGEWEKQSNRSSSSSPFGDTPENTESRDNTAVFAQWLAEWPRLTVQLGSRLDHNERFGDFGTYRAGASYRLTRALRVRASAGTSFKEPRFYEQFAQGFVRGNPALEPERSRSLEAGAEWSSGRVTLSAAWFGQEFEDLIQYIGTTPTPEDPNYVNVAGAEASGAEFGMGLRLPKLQLRGTYTLLETEVTDDGDGEDPSFQEGEKLLRRPRHAASLVATVPVSAVSISLAAHYVGEREDLNFSAFPSERVTLPAYTRVDLSGEYRVSDAFSVNGKIENILDERYQEIYGFAAARRVFHLGLRATWR